MKGRIKSLEDIPNLMGFISQTEKTGVLTLVNKGDQVEVGFIKGKVNAAIYKRSGVQELIKEYLVNSGKITEADFDKISLLHKETRKPYESLLISEKYINESTWIAIIHFKIQEVIDELFIWKSGSYEFIEDIIMYENSKFKVNLNTQGLIMEGMRRIDEWPNILSLLPSTSMCFEIDSKVEAPDNIGNDEKRLIEIIDGSRDLKELVRISGLGKYITYQSIYNLLKLGIIRKTKRIHKKRQDESRKKIKFNKFAIISWILIISFIALAGIAGILSYEYTFSLVSSTDTENIANITYNKENIDYLLKIYFVKYGTYPESLDKLSEINWVDNEYISDFSYYLNENDYILLIK